MGVGLRIDKDHLLTIRNQFKNSSLLTKTLFIVSLLFLVASIFEVSLLGISGSFIVASVAVFNSDIQRHSDYVKSEVEKARALNEFQNYLIFIIHQLEGVRSNYARLFDYEKEQHLHHKRALEVPVLAYIPQFDSQALLKIFSNLSFTASLITREEAENIDKKALSTSAKSLTVLSFHISTIEALSKLWELHNEFYHKCNKKPNPKDPALITFDFETFEDIQVFHNYMLATDRCLTLTDKVLIYSQAALDYFIPAATEKIHGDALDKCPVPKISDKIFKTAWTFNDLSEEEQKALDRLPYELQKAVKKDGK